MNLIHFIGGPWHGETREELNKPPTIKGIRMPLPRVTWSYSSRPVAEIPKVDFEEFEYRRMSPDPQAGYVLYRYVEPTEKHEVSFVIEVKRTLSDRARARIIEGVETIINRFDGVVHANPHYTVPIR